MSQLSGNPEQVPYTPATEEIEVAFIIGECLTSPGFTAADAKSWFERWFAEELRKAKKEGWDEGFFHCYESDASDEFVSNLDNPYLDAETSRRENK